MPATLVFGGLGCGALLAGTGLALWGGYRPDRWLAQAIRAIRWLASICLLIATLIIGIGGLGLLPPFLSIEGTLRANGAFSRWMLLATLAAPPGLRRRSHSDPQPFSQWRTAMLILPALTFTGAGLFGAASSAGTDAIASPISLIGLLTIICGGFGARAMGQALAGIVASPSKEAVFASRITYTLLTLLIGSTALGRLWQEGIAYGIAYMGTAIEGGLTGVWLAWSAVLLGPSRPQWLRPALTVAVGLILLVVVFSFT
jgi:hypothetical protein